MVIPRKMLVKPQQKYHVRGMPCFSRVSIVSILTFGRTCVGFFLGVAPWFLNHPHGSSMMGSLHWIKPNRKRWCPNGPNGPDSVPGWPFLREKLTNQTGNQLMVVRLSVADEKYPCLSLQFAHNYIQLLSQLLVSFLIFAKCPNCLLCSVQTSSGKSCTFGVCMPSYVSNPQVAVGKNIASPAPVSERAARRWAAQAWHAAWSPWHLAIWVGSPWFTYGICRIPCCSQQNTLW